jgi:serine-type D-Ala-D-Ala carboxypeptidase (penicillin-binding protein 5/6)
MMNRQAQAFNLKNTAFKNATGLTEAGHKSSARDLAVIATHIIRDYPEFFALYSIKEYKYNNINQPNRNLLLRRDPTVDGLKTGYTDAAGYCLIATAQREFPNLGANGVGPGKRRILTVLLHTTSMETRANESQKLLNWGFQAFDTMRLFNDGKPILTSQVWKGKVPQAQLGAAGGLFVTVPKGEGGKLQTKVEHTDPLVAPLAKGQRVGTIKVTTASGAPVVDVPLVVLEPVEEAGIFGRAWDALRLWIK